MPDAVGNSSSIQNSLTYHKSCIWLTQSSKESVRAQEVAKLKQTFAASAGKERLRYNIQSILLCRSVGGPIRKSL